MDITALREHFHREFQGEQFQVALTAIDCMLDLPPGQIPAYIERITLAGQTYPQDDPYYVLSWCLSEQRLVTYQEWLHATQKG